MTQEVKHYWLQLAKAAAVRAVRTWAQAFIASMPVTGATLGSIDWVICASTATAALILSLLTSLAGLPEVEMPTEMIAEQYEASDAMIKEEEK